MPALTEKIEELGKRKIDILQYLRKNHRMASLGEVRLDQAIGGMRGIKGMICETSELDPEFGITYRDHKIEDLRGRLPTVQGGKEPLPEALLWLLLTGEIPSPEETMMIQQELASRAKVPKHVEAAIDALPASTHPMTQLVVGVTAMQTESKFATLYRDGLHKTQYWKPILNDSLDLIASIPIIAARIYRRTFKDGKTIPPDPSLDWSASFTKMLGYEDPNFYELMRLYLFLHADHEGGNVSAHTTHLVGSALSDPYLSMGAGLAGLAGPLHGLANQECLRWILDLKDRLKGQPPSDELIAKLAQETLDSGRVIPGFGHAVLRVTDPRYMAQRAFALEHLKDSELFRIVDACYKTIPVILQKTGKVKNPWPNVDAHSGILLHHYGLTEADYFTVLFGVSRTIGCLSQLVWSRLLGFPIERPKSVTIHWLDKSLTDTQGDSGSLGLNS